MQVYKLRAECKADINNLLAAFNASWIDIDGFTEEDDYFNEVELTFSTDADKNTIVNAISSVFDGHVMLETFQEIERYTGIRTD